MMLADRVEAESMKSPRPDIDDMATGDGLDTLSQFERSLVREGQSEDVLRRYAFVEQIDDPGNEGLGLARAGTGAE